jgi:hypothetical protein
MPRFVIPRSDLDADAAKPGKPAEIIQIKACRDFAEPSQNGEKTHAGAFLFNI